MTQTSRIDSRMGTLVVDALRKSAEFSSEERDWLAGWFVAAGQSGESLVQFLVRQQMLEPGVIPSVAMVEKGFLSPDAIRHLFGPDLALQLRNARQLQISRGQIFGVSSEPSKREAKASPSTWEQSQLSPPTPSPFSREESTVGMRSPRTTPPGQSSVAHNESFVELQPRPKSTLSTPRVKPASTIFHQATERYPRPMEIKPGAKLGKCLLTEQIGKGGAGVVFRAIHESLNITVAVKIIRSSGVENRDTANDVAQMRTEAQILAQMNHPHVIRIFDFDVDPEPYMVLEYVEGWALSELIHQAGALRYDRALLIVRQAAMALQAAYSSGIIHRDVKPANLLISRGGVTKLADLGLAVMRQGGQGSVYGDNPVGTLAYMPPEQALNSKADFRSDIYSLGATFYHAVTGRTLFPSRGLAESMLNVVSGVPVSPAELAPGLDPLAVETILRMIAKDPAERFDNYEQLLDALNTLTERHGKRNTNCLSISEIVAPTVPGRIVLSPEAALAE